MAVEKISQAEMRWKVFAQEYTANGFMANKAARVAGYAEDDIRDGVAQQLLKRPEVLRYVRSFTERIAKKYAVTRDFIFEGLEDALNRAIETDDTAARIKALSEMAKLAGFMVEKHEHKVSPLADILDDDLKAKQLLS